MMADKDDDAPVSPAVSNVRPISERAAAKPPPVRTLSAVDLIGTHRRGDLARAIDAAIVDVSAKVRDRDTYGPKGKVTLTIAIERDPKSNALIFKPGVKKAEPDQLVADGYYFQTDDGRLTRQDPRQTDLEEFSGRE